MDELKPNSHKYKEEQKKLSEVPEKKIEKVVTGVAKAKKKSLGQKFVETFISEDVINIKSYIFNDIIIPGVKRAVVDGIINSVCMLFGEPNPVRRTGGIPTASKVSYQKYYDNNRVGVTQRDPRDARKTNFDYDEVVITDRGEAEDVLERMKEIISIYKIASIADLYDMVGLPDDYTHNKYGWTDLSSARVVPTRDGFVLKFPRPMPID